MEHIYMHIPVGKWSIDLLKRNADEFIYRHMPT
jgi:hypothetical protein